MKPASLLLSCLLVLAASALTAACSGGGGGGGEDFIGATSIQAFSIDASYLAPPVVGDPVIDANVDDGQFALQWQIDQPGISYDAKVYLSQTAVAVREEDPKILDLDCGPPSELCADSGLISCALGKNNHVVCENGADTDLSAWLKTVPQHGYIVLNVSRSGNGSGSGAMKSIPVQIR